jgi:hypothetical protein
MPPSVATWSFWIAVCACAAGQIAILRDTVGARGPDGTSPETDPDEPASPPPVRRRVPGRLHATGEVIWAVLPGIGLALVLLWTWHVMHGDRPVTTHPESGPTARAIATR